MTLPTNPTTSTNTSVPSIPNPNTVDTNTSVPSMPNITTNGTNNIIPSASVPPVSFPPFVYKYNQLTAAPTTFTAAEFTSPDKGFTCFFCNTQKPFREQRAVYGADGYSTLWVGCIDCFRHMMQSTTESERALRLLAQAAAYVQICHEGGDWDLLDSSSQASAELLTLICQHLHKSETWNPSQERRSGKL